MMTTCGSRVGVHAMDKFILFNWIRDDDGKYRMVCHCGLTIGYESPFAQFGADEQLFGDYGKHCATDHPGTLAIIALSGEAWFTRDTTPVQVWDENTERILRSWTRN